MPARRGRKRPNIILLGIDSLRRAPHELLRYKRLTTPHIDRFAQDGVLCGSRHSAPCPDHQRLCLYAHGH